MSSWYYATAEGQQFGPLSTEELTDLFHAGRIGSRTRVWRQGEPEWRLLSDFMDELGLRPTADGDRPVPPTLPPIPQSAVPPATSNGAAAATTTPIAPAAAPKKGRSGCAVIGIVLALVGVFVVLPVLAIIAAVALPAYQDYAVRAKTAEILTRAESVKPMIAEFAMESGRCPTEDDAVFQAIGERLMQSGQISSIELGADDSEDYLCRLNMTLAMSEQSQLSGRDIRLVFDMDTINWACNSDLSSRYLPASCRD